MIFPPNTESRDVDLTMRNIRDELCGGWTIVFLMAVSFITSGVNPTCR